MNSAPLPAPVFVRLARLSPAPDGLTLLRSALHARRLLLLKALLVRVHRHRESVEPGALGRFDRAWDLLERVEERHPAVVRDVLDYPTTGAWLADALAESPGPAFDRLLGHLDNLAVTAALRAGGPLDLTVETPDGLLPLPGVGRLAVAADRVRVSAGERTVRFHPDGARHPVPAVLRLTGGHDGVLAGHGPGWRAVRPLPGGSALLDDLDPYRVPFGGGGGTVVAAADPADTDHAAWAATWCAARDLLARTDPGRAAEVARGVRAVVPVVPRGPRHLGATLSAAPGAVLTSLPAEGQGMAETLVHELHHSKLATLHELVPLYGPGRGAVHRVGWRSDPRPIAGVLHGAYAHLALADLWWRAVTADGVPAAWRSAAGQQFDDIHDQVGEALPILLESDELTANGREFVRQMGLHHASLGATPLVAG
ncbi:MULTISPECIES: aKG-HExxH-type peptide beta-hydroxylase [Streptomyces]|uniref:HEXXH motif-containing protein n=1 Tax=Streptomyces nymphaeiformis TaxID=2663842 RepID=A0A7W7U2S5_9ACTN|nr:HEXXH motif-containing putative peptide modification protein [Streptomyces nymphaeiformis]MBB4983067.1 HEXXH motif-containing protein [Streptomyces nymphaeiformis]